jgi:hypothetical protein
VKGNAARSNFKASMARLKERLEASIAPRAYRQN